MAVVDPSDVDSLLLDISTTKMNTDSVEELPVSVMVVGAEVLLLSSNCVGYDSICSSSRTTKKNAAQLDSRRPPSRPTTTSNHYSLMILSSPLSQGCDRAQRGLVDEQVRRSTKETEPEYNM